VTVDPREQALRWIQGLAAIERPSASPGEREAAEWVAGQLGKAATPARVEAEAAHGTHLPFVMPSALALLAGLVRSRPVALVTAALAAAAIVDELEGRRRLVRRALARRETYNVVGEAGNARGARTLVFVAHHDAARPWFAAFGALVSSRLPRLLGGGPLPVAPTLAYAPLTVLVGVAARVRALRLAGIALCAFVVALFADIARRPPVPGANDNASGVAALLGIASDLAGHPPKSLRVLLVSAGAEETMLEGMDAFLRRHRDELDPARTIVVCLDQLGWDRLLLCESEGVLRRYGSRAEDVELVLRAARAAAVGVEVAPPFVSPSDGLAARWAGLPTIFLSSAAAGGGYPHYHRPSDVPENVNVDTVVAARRLCSQLVTELDTRPCDTRGTRPSAPSESA
jgi:acetylornithine deacetylase/succinyl-diaminopimelate desuccinylase-like protein